MISEPDRLRKLAGRGQGIIPREAAVCMPIRNYARTNAAAAAPHSGVHGVPQTAFGAALKAPPSGNVEKGRRRRQPPLLCMIRSLAPSRAHASRSAVTILRAWVAVAA